MVRGKGDEGEHDQVEGWIQSDAEADFDQQRAGMVRQQIEARGIKDGRVLNAISRVPRHRFLPPIAWQVAYDDSPQPIGFGQTISQPYIVALMTQLVRPATTDRALEVGTGCGYQAAVLAELVAELFSIEVVQPLAERARQTLDSLGYQNIHARCGDGYRGWPEAAPFDIILVTAAPGHIPEPLVDQLAVGGRMVIPVGRGHQELQLIEKLTASQFRQSSVGAVAFVPMTGEAAGRHSESSGGFE